MNQLAFCKANDIEQSLWGNFSYEIHLGLNLHLGQVSREGLSAGASNPLENLFSSSKGELYAV